MPDLSDAKILILATDGFEDSELIEPRKRLEEAGASVILASPDEDEIEGAKGAKVKPDRRIADVDADQFDALLLPGGTKNPDKLRMDGKAVAIVRAFFDADKPVGAICHAPWLLIEADAVRGRTVTSWPSLRTDLANAGAEVVDQEAVVDGNLVTSRKPEDIPAFVDAFMRIVEKAGAEMASA